MRLALFVLSAAAVVCVSESRRLREARATTSAFIGEATNELATAILQGYEADNKNLAFSPLGYSVILAILAEGARGETKTQLTLALGLPKDVAITRRTYRYIMERLKNTNEYKYNQPELKNWFYVYKNYTINDVYKKTLEDHYLTEVRTVERYVPYNPTSDDDDDKAEASETKKVEVTPEPNYQPEPDNNEGETVDLLPPKETDEKLISFAVEDIPEKVETPPADFEYNAKNIKEKIKLAKTNPKKTEYSSEDEETMVAVEARNHGRSLKLLNDKNDISSSISVNSVGQKTSPASNSLMIMFNGMYFRGAWRRPFTTENLGNFYTSPYQKKLVPMMMTRGRFRTGRLHGLDSVAVELPYAGGRYSLVLVVPRTRDGLARLVADLPSTPLSTMLANLKSQMLTVSVPSFYVETTTKPVAALAKFGVSSIFSPEADLSGISSTEGLFVQEMVQHVAVRVDNARAGNTEKEKTLAGPSLRTSEINADEVVQFDEKTNNIYKECKADPTLPDCCEAYPTLPGCCDNEDEDLPNCKKEGGSMIRVGHPFVFFVHDVLDNLVVAAGKIVDPKQHV